MLLGSSSLLHSFREAGTDYPSLKYLQPPLLDHRVWPMPGSDVAWGNRALGLEKRESLAEGPTLESQVLRPP